MRLPISRQNESDLDRWHTRKHIRECTQMLWRYSMKDWSSLLPWKEVVHVVYYGYSACIRWPSWIWQSCDHSVLLLLEIWDWLTHKHIIWYQNHCSRLYRKEVITDNRHLAVILAAILDFQFRPCEILEEEELKSSFKISAGWVLCRTGPITARARTNGLFVKIIQLYKYHVPFISVSDIDADKSQRQTNTEWSEGKHSDSIGCTDHLKLMDVSFSIYRNTIT